MTRPLSLTDHTALSLLLTQADAFSWEIANACGLRAGRRILPQNRNMLRRLERWGYVTRGKTPNGHYARWAITDAGRKAVQP